MTTDAPTFVTETCEECTLPFERPPGRRKRRCFSCRMAAAGKAIDDQRNRQGDIYERVVRKQLLYWRSEATRLGIRA